MTLPKWLTSPSGDTRMLATVLVFPAALVLCLVLDFLGVAP